MSRQRTRTHHAEFPHAEHPTGTGVRVHPRVSVSALWASAFVITALILVEAGRLPERSAEAGMATSSSTYSVVTSRSGLGEITDPNDLLWIVDGRDQVLLVYQMDASRGSATLSQVHAATLPEEFGRASRR